MTNEQLIAIAEEWFQKQGWKPFEFQQETWQHFLDGYSGILNAPTGSGKTYALLLPILMDFIRRNPAAREKENNGMNAIWITPIRALAKEILLASGRAVEAFGLNWKVSIRSGDTTTAERKKQLSKPPELLITTPESLHLLLASKGYEKFFANLGTVVIDEWHELMGSKRAVLAELALSRLKGFLPQLQIWGISATIGNMDQALTVLLGSSRDQLKHKIIKADIEKRIDVITVLPDEIEKFPWSGHLGIHLLNKVVPLIHNSGSTLIFTNTRAMCEIWYQRLLDVAPELAGLLAMHHGSISRELRDWVEQNLHSEKLKAVVCTSSLDLGVDFRPVESIVQIGSPKGVARFMQRAGRSGHQPNALSTIYFVPTHSLELIESCALRQAMADGQVEDRLPYIRSFDVLAQYLVTLAVSDGFLPDQILAEVRDTFCFESISDEEWQWILNFIVTGGQALHSYNEYRKVEIDSDGLFRVHDRRIALRHRLSIGAIVGETSMIIQYQRGKRIGTVEEWFIAQLRPGDTFWFAGKSLELIRVKGMTAEVRKSKKKKGKVPSWLGGRIPLSSQLAQYLRIKVAQSRADAYAEPELEKLIPLTELQDQRSRVPLLDEFLIEYFQSTEGYHLLFYPFEGRYIHEGMSALLAWRIAQIQPISFTIAMNDYGFELLSDAPIPIEKALDQDLFNTIDLTADIQASINSVEMAKRRFRDIASIAGLVFKGYPGREKKDKYLQSSSQLFFEVFTDYEPDNLLLRQAFEEVFVFQLDEYRLREALDRIQSQRIILSRPDKATPYSFPIIVDRTREKLSTERLADRIKKMKLALERD